VASAAAAPPRAPVSLLAALPADKRAALLKLLPPGWKPGDPLPANLPSLASLLGGLKKAS